MTPLATTADFEARYGDAPATAEALLSDASSLILNEVSNSTLGWVVDYAADELPDPAADVPQEVIAVVCAVVNRAAQNRADVASEQLGQHSVSFRDRGPDALYLTKLEKRTVRKAAGLGSHRAVTLETPYSGRAEVDRDLTL